MAVPYTFGSATTSIPLSQLDSNFATTITLGNTAIQLGNTVTTLNNMTLANVTVSSGNVTATNVTATNVTSPLSTALTLQSNAGNTAVTIDTSQNVGIGTASPSTKLAVVQNQNASSQVSISNNTGGASSQALFSATDGTNYGQFGMWGSGVSASGAQQPSNAYVYGSGGVSYFTGGTHRWYYNTNTEAMRIDSSGNVGIGATPSSWGSSYKALQIGGGASGNFLNFQAPIQLISCNAYYNGSNYVYQSSNYAGIFDFNGSSAGGFSWRLAASGTAGNTPSFTQAMTLDSSGNLLLGQTSQNSTEKLGLTVSGSNSFAYFRSTATSGNPVMVRLTTGNLSGGIGTGSFVYCDDGGSAKFFVAGSGVVNSTSTSITAISDSRLKENVRDLETGLNTVLALKPRRFDWKQGEGTDQKDVAGFIAQEVETVLPELVGEWKHDPDSETIYKSLAMGNMIPTMVKAIQELKAINDQQAETINALTARVVALEAK